MAQVTRGLPIVGTPSKTGWWTCFIHTHMNPCENGGTPNDRGCSFGFPWPRWKALRPFCFGASGPQSQVEPDDSDDEVKRAKCAALQDLRLRANPHEPYPRLFMDWDGCLRGSRKGSARIDGLMKLALATIAAG